LQSKAAATTTATTAAVFTQSQHPESFQTHTQRPIFSNKKGFNIISVVEATPLPHLQEQTKLNKKCANLHFEQKNIF
jgi:hypothetical protein